MCKTNFLKEQATVTIPLSNFVQNAFSKEFKLMQWLFSQKELSIQILDEAIQQGTISQQYWPQ